MTLLRRAFLAALISLPVAADIVATKSGQKLEGKVISENDAEIVVRTYKDGDVTVKKSDLKNWTKGRSKFDEYDARVADKPPKTAEDQFQLGTWCKGKGLATLAKEHFQKAVDLDPAMDKARLAMGMKKAGGKWVTEEEYDRIQKKNNPDATPLELKISTEADLPKEKLEAIAKHFASLAPHFWFMTEGNFYLKTVTIADRGKGGNVFVAAGDEDKEFIAGGGQTQPGVQMKVGGHVSMFTFLHESGHLFWSLPDEYKNKGGGCPACVMIGGDMAGFGPGLWKFCDESNHTGATKPDCWAQIRAKYPKVKHPNKDFHAGDAPEPQVIVNNTGN